MSIAAKFGKKLRELRLKKDLTQEDIAYKADVTVYYASKIERGFANPSLETLYKIAKAFNMDLSELLRGVTA